MDNQNGTKKLVGTRIKIILYGAMVAGSLMSFLTMYPQLKPKGFGWVAFVAAGGTLVMGFAIITLFLWYANRQQIITDPEKARMWRLKCNRIKIILVIVGIAFLVLGEIIEHLQRLHGK